MDNYTDALTRISYIISLLTSKKYLDNRGNPVLSINRLHDITGIPHNILVRDIRSLLDTYFTKDNVHFSWDWEEDDNECDEMEDFSTSLITFQKDACEKRFFISHELLQDIFGNANIYPILLDSLEKNMLSKILRKNYADNVWIKESPFAPPEKVVELQKMIRIAIEENHPITFSYTDSKGEHKDYKEYNAYRLFETVNEGVVYVISVNPDDTLDLKRLDRMADYSPLEDKEMPPFNEDALKRLDYMWDADLNSEENDPTTVTLLIEENTKNIISKIESETSRRKYGKLEKFSKKKKAFQKKYDKLIQKLIPNDHSEKAWIYTDEVLGMNSFKRWLRKYGSSVLVLEPKELAMEMKESAERKLSNYETLILNH